MGKAASEPIPFAGSQLGATRHVCAFFRNADEEYRVLLPFIQDGFESGDRGSAEMIGRPLWRSMKEL
jgi:hypothetical protein